MHLEKEAFKKLLCKFLSFTSSLLKDNKSQFFFPLVTKPLLRNAKLLLLFFYVARGFSRENIQ
jgi:hypothetical protein